MRPHRFTPACSPGWALALGAISAFVLAPGCGDTALEGGQGGSDGKAREASQGLTSAPVCLSLRRQGATGAVLDTQIANALPAKLYGASQNMNAGIVSGAERQTLLQFDLGAIPAGPGTSIQSATVTLSSALAPTGPATIEAHRITAPWVEATTTWQTFNGAYDAAVTSTFANAPPTFTFDVLPLVTGWVQGAFPNYGVLLKDPALSYATNDWSSEYPTVSLRPRLDVCYAIACASGFADCNNDGLDGCERDLTTSSDCGACGHACAAPLVCSGGACQAIGCGPGLGDCNGDAGDGCETPLDTLANCGACNHACAFPGGTATCAGGVCALLACDPGHHDCDGNPANGCEVAPCPDGSHCGSGADCASGVCGSGLCAAPPVGPPPDASGPGPLATTSGDYQLPATTDPDILGDRVTEIWARLYRPQDVSGGPYPVIVFLHGNHATCGNTATPRVDANCSYTTLGACVDPSYPVVVPSHLGFGYIADRLASWGYLVVSINANRGITCGAGVTGDAGLNLARGRLILKHLALLSGWSRAPGTTPASLGVDLAGRVDLGNVGLVGHSRSGEGIRAAYALYLDAGSPWPGRIVTPVTFGGLFEISGNDGQTSRVLDAPGTSWHTILPGCDNDNYTLEGVKPFDRMVAATTEAPLHAPKSYTVVRGANHRFYNTQWQISDASGCAGTDNTPIFSPSGSSSPQQQLNFQQLGMAFFRAHLTSPVPGASDPTFARNLDPFYALNPAIAAVTQVDRSWIGSPADTVELDNMKTGVHGASGVNLGYTAVPEHDGSLRAATIGWATAGSGVWFESDWTSPGSGLDLSADQGIDFRVSRQVSSTVPVGAPTDLSIRLVGASGSLSGAVKLSTYLRLDAPPAGTRATHVLLRTVRIPLADFTGASLTAVRGVRFVFNQSASGAIYLADVRRRPSVLGMALASADLGDAAPASPSTTVTGSRGTVVLGAAASLRVARSGASPAGGGVEVELSAAEPFPVDDALPILRVGGVDVLLSAFPEDGDTRRIIFTLTPADLGRLHGGEPMHVQYGLGDAPEVRWDAGRFPANRVLR
jgi:hypothetical protein